MKTVEKTYLALLRAGLWDTKVSVEGDVDWKALMVLAKRQSTTALICHAALQLEGNVVPTSLQPKMQAFLLKTINAHASMNRAIASIVTRLHEQGIDSVLLKGQGVASYYPTPLLRQCGDIDLYVEDYAAACDSIRTEDDGRKTEDDGRKTEDGGRKTEDGGQRTEDEGRKTEDDGRKTEDGGRRTEDEGRKTEDDGRKTEDGGQRTEDEGRKTEDGGRRTLALSRSEATDKHTEFDLGGGLSLEIHEYTEMLDDARQNAAYQTFSDDGTTNDLVPIVFNGVSVMTPEDTFNTFYIFHHLWHHTIGLGMGLRQVCDWAVFLHTHTGELDTKRLKMYLSELGLMDQWQVYGSLIVQYLGVKADEVPFYDAKKNRRATRLLHYILTEGDNREFKFGRPEHRTKKKAATLRYIFRKTTRLLPIFPSEAMRYFIHSIHSGLKKARKPSRLVL